MCGRYILRDVNSDMHRDIERMKNCAHAQICTKHVIEQPLPLLRHNISHARMSAKFSLCLFVSLTITCLHPHPWHGQVEAEVNHGSRLGTQQSWKSEQMKLQSVAKQLYVDGDLLFFLYALHSYY